MTMDHEPSATNNTVGAVKRPPLPSRHSRKMSSIPQLPSKSSRPKLVSLDAGTSTSSTLVPDIALPIELIQKPEQIAEPAEIKEEDMTPRTRVKTMEEKRQDVINEIVATERTFVDGLKYLEQTYMTPLRSMLQKKDYNVMFQHIVIIINVNALLLTNLEQVLQNRTTVSQVFIKYGPMLKSYTDYVNNYDSILKQVRSLRQQNSDFDTFMRNAEQKGKSEGRVSFQSIMITPVQRLPRYNLLLAELLKRTPDEHEEHKLLETALHLTKDVSVHVNERLRDQENKKTLIKLHQHINGLDTFEFIQASRRLLYKPVKFDAHIEDDDDNHLTMGQASTVRILRGKKRRDLLLHIFVFNDMILFIRKGKYKFHHLFNDCVWIYKSALIPNVFEIVTKERIYLIRMDTGQELLYKELSGAVSRYMSNNHSYPSSLSIKYDMLCNDPSMDTLYPLHTMMQPFQTQDVTLQVGDRVYLECMMDNGMCMVTPQALYLRKKKKGNEYKSVLIPYQHLLSPEKQNNPNQQPVYLQELQRRNSLSQTRNRSVSSPPKVINTAPNIPMQEILNRRNSLKPSAMRPSIDTNLLHVDKTKHTANSKTPPWLSEIENKFKGDRFANVVHLKRQSMTLEDTIEIPDDSLSASDDESSEDEDL